MIEGHATARYVRTSAQKAGLVLDLIRGRDVNKALATLRFARKGVARDVEKVLRSAVANAQQKQGASGDVERLFVSACYAGQGPSLKRIRPAPMGRAFRVVKRTAHLTVHVTERQARVALATVAGADQPAASPTGDTHGPRRTPARRAATRRKTTAPAKRHATGGRKKKTAKKS
jgi:large subunit ribosomal protein L22